MRASAETKLRDNLDEWEEVFRKDDEPIHGVLLVTGESRHRIEKTFGKVKKIFSIGKEGATIQEVISIFGDVRPGDEHAHEQSVLKFVVQNIVTTTDVVPASVSWMASPSPQSRTIHLLFIQVRRKLAKV
jgi:hypothetical protein